MTKVKGMLPKMDGNYVGYDDYLKILVHYQALKPSFLTRNPSSTLIHSTLYSVQYKDTKCAIVIGVVICVRLDDFFD